jgi:hypothetical protein
MFCIQNAAVDSDIPHQKERNEGVANGDQIDGDGIVMQRQNKIEELVSTVGE